MSAIAVDARAWPVGLFPPDARRLLGARDDVVISTLAAATVSENNQRCFSISLWFAVFACVIGMVTTFAVFDAFDAWPTIILGITGVLFFSGLIWQSDRVFQLSTETNAILVPATAFCFAALVSTGNSNPSYFNLVFAPLLLAAFSGRRRAVYVCAGAMIVADAVGYLIFAPAVPVIGEALDASLFIADATEIVIVAILLNALADALARSIAHIDRPATSDSDGGDATDNLPRLSKLTARELETVLWLGGGLTNREIGERMFLSVRTVESHIASALRKTDCDNRTMLAVGVARRAVRERLAREGRAVAGATET